MRLALVALSLALAGCGPGRRAAPSRPAPPAAGPCVVSGCSGQLCVEQSAGGGLFSTCEWRARYACYRTARCERQPDGRCGWAMDDALKACLRDARE